MILRIDNLLKKAKNVAVRTFHYFPMQYLLRKICPNNNRYKFQAIKSISLSRYPIHKNEQRTHCQCNTYPCHNGTEFNIGSYTFSSHQGIHGENERKARKIAVFSFY